MIGHCCAPLGLSLHSPILVILLPTPVLPPGICPSFTPMQYVPASRVATQLREPKRKMLCE